MLPTTATVPYEKLGTFNVSKLKHCIAAAYKLTCPEIDLAD